MRKIRTEIVTVGAGFIGSAVNRQIFDEANATVVNVDALTNSGNLESLNSVTENPRHFFNHVDISNRVEIEHIFTQHAPDAIMPVVLVS